MPPGLRQGLFAIASPELRRRIEMANGPQQMVARDLSEGKLLRAVYSNRQLDEVLTDFWFNHFNVFLDKGADRYLVTEYERDVIRPHVLGKFHDLLEATAKSPAMLFYLDNWQSVGPDAPQARGKKGARGLNENYGRELLELHTLGVDGGYTQKDVTEVARCFTGWTILQPQRAASSSSTSACTMTARRWCSASRFRRAAASATARRCSTSWRITPPPRASSRRQLAMRFVADDPPPSLVDRMARDLPEDRWRSARRDEDHARVQGILREGAYRTKMKSPLEVVASAVRAINGDVDFAFPLVNQVAQLGQPLYRKQEPTGYSNSSQEWLNSGGLLARMNFALQLADNKVPGVKVDASKAAAPEIPSPVSRWVRRSFRRGKSCLTRRFFLRNSALAMVGVGAAPLWLERALYAADAPAARKKILVAIFQRGAADGLNVVVPHGEKAYYDLRPTIAIPRPTSDSGRKADAAIDLDGFFGLHPSLAPLKPLFDQQHLAIVDAVGSPDPTRSHFDAQDYMESGTPGRKATQDGWMNRALPKAEGKVSPVRAVSLGPVLPRAMRGQCAGGGDADHRGLPGARTRRPRSSSSRCIRTSKDPLIQAAGRETFEAVAMLQSHPAPARTRRPPAPNIRAGASDRACSRSRS